MEKIKIIPLPQVQYIEAADDYVKIFTADGTFLKKKTMQYFEDSLPPAGIHPLFTVRMIVMHN